MSTIIQAAQQMRLSAQAQGLLRPELAARAAVQTLLDAGLAADALGLLMRLLPRRYAVAWLCQCSREQSLSEQDRAGTALAESWVRDPSEAHRRAAFDFAKTHRYKSIGAWIAAAAGWSGGNLAPPSQDLQVPPPEQLTALAAAAAVTHIAALVADQFKARREAFVRSALGLLGTPTASTEV